MKRKAIAIFAIFTLVISMMAAMTPGAGAAPGLSYNYTLNADFTEGDLNNVVASSDQLQLSEETEPFKFIWVAVSSKGTAVKIDTETGAVLGEYWTHPYMNGSSNPSRTTVDKNGNAWVANRGYTGSVTHYAAIPTDQNGDGVITTSTGLGDVLPWGTDEALLHHTTVNSNGARHVSVDADNNVWVSGTGGRNFDLIDGDTGAIIRSETSVGFGGYGGLIDGNGVIWSARNLLRWDTANPLSGANGGNWDGYYHDSYGLGIDSKGNVWNTALSGSLIRKFAPDGSLIGTYNHGSYYAQGCVADESDDIWVAGSLYGSSVDHMLNDGTYLGSVFLASGAGPTDVTPENSSTLN